MHGVDLVYLFLIVRNASGFLIRHRASAKLAMISSSIHRTTAIATAAALIASVQTTGQALSARRVGERASSNDEVGSL